MRILAIVNSDYGRRHVDNIRKHAPGTWQIEVWEAARAYPQVADYSDTLMHISGNIMREAVGEQVKPFKQIQYFVPGWRSEETEFSTAEKKKE
ncbi:MAG: hypothetical protein QMD04_00520 [Anaerolineales bacterium]|nr:hypothetical protein [Anaerolineales bacterium]